MTEVSWGQVNTLRMAEWKNVDANKWVNYPTLHLPIPGHLFEIISKFPYLRIISLIFYQKQLDIIPTILHSVPEDEREKRTPASDTADCSRTTRIHNLPQCGVCVRRTTWHSAKEEICLWFKSDLLAGAYPDQYSPRWPIFWIHIIYGAYMAFGHILPPEWMRYCCVVWSLLHFWCVLRPTLQFHSRHPHWDCSHTDRS